MAEPRQEFRAELASLRRSVIRSIQESVPSNIEEGLDLYRRLLSRMLKRFDVLYEDELPRYERFPMLPSASGQEMEWLRSDYEDFVVQALATRSRGALQAVVRGLFRIINTCIRAGDIGALSLFLDLVTYIWATTARDSELDGSFKSIREDLLRYVDSQSSLTIGGTPESKRQKSATPAILARLIKTYSDFMKESVDVESDLELRATANHLVDVFIRDAAIFRDIGEDGQPPSERGRLLSQLTSAALSGIDGWILYRSQHGTSQATSQLLRDAVRPAAQRVNPWDALPIVSNFNYEQYFGWVGWELFSVPDRQGATVSITGYIRSAMLLEAITRAIPPTLEEIRRAVAGPNELHELRGVIEMLLRDVDALQASQWEMTDIHPDAITALIEQLKGLQDQVQTQLTEALIQQDLDPQRVAEFRSVVRAGRSAGRLTELFAATQPDDPSMEVATDASSAPTYVTFGYNQMISKEYFVDSPVIADVRMMASQFVQGQLNTENQYLLNQLQGFLPIQKTDPQQIAATVATDLKRLQQGQDKPVILLFGRSSVARQFQSGKSAWSQMDGQGMRSGEFEGYEFHWVLSVNQSYCVVLVPNKAGVVLWKPLETLDGDLLEEGGHLLVGIRKVTEDVAAALLTESPGLGTRDGIELSQQEAIRRLQQDVQVRILEQFGFLPGTQDAGTIFDLT